jgi:hypothetical protein
MNNTATLFLMIAMAAVGCGGGPPSGRLAVSGEVLLDGQPLDQGAVQFQPEGTTSKLNAGGVITNGKYRIDTEHGLPPGKYKVSITSVPKDTRSAQEIMDKPGAPPTERIAAKYNTESSEIVEVSKTGKNQFDFKVESAKP